MHDIVDNSNIKLSKVLREKLSVSKRARIAVGWFFLSGLKEMQKEIDGLNSLEILAGSKTNRQTAELMLLSKKYDKAVSDAIEDKRFLPESERQKILDDEFRELVKHISAMEATEDNIAFVKWFFGHLQTGKIKIRIYPKETLHAKLYLLDFRDTRHGQGIGYVGSSNLSMSGFSLNTELNVAVHGDQNHKALAEWFDERWKVSEATDFTALAQKALNKSWPLNKEVTPFRAYLKVLHEIFAYDAAKEVPETSYNEAELKVFQRDAVEDAYRRLFEYNGVFIADVPGLGKTYMGSALLAHLQEEGKRSLIVCPPKLIPQWLEVLSEFGVGTARVLSNSAKSLERILEDERLMKREILLIDEAHHFRNSETNRYKDMEMISENKKVILLGATPHNLDIWDLYNQIKLFTPSEINHKFRIDPPSLKDFFKECEVGNKDIEDLISQILIRRIRKNIIEDYPQDKIHFPKRIGPKRVDYSIEHVYKGGIYKRLSELIKRLSFARYDIGSYTLEGEFSEDEQARLKQAGKNLKKLMSIILFRRLESSFVAFKESARVMHDSHKMFLRALDEDKVLAGESAEKVINKIRSGQELDDIEFPEDVYKADRFDAKSLREAIEKDEEVVSEMVEMVSTINISDDDKLHQLIDILKNDVKGKKTIIFSAFAKTAKYLAHELDKEFDKVELVTQSTGKSLEKAKRFAPKANNMKIKKEDEIDILVSTEILSEGLNLQDGQIVINYELHWNPVRIIQRIGRIDRIGSEHDKIWVYNFFPEEEAEKEINVETKVKKRIEEIIKFYGADEKTISEAEEEKVKKLYEIYSEDEKSLEDPETESKSSYYMREFKKLTKKYSDEYRKSLDLPPMVNTGMKSKDLGIAAFLRADDYFKLILADKNAQIISRNDWDILSLIESTPETKPQSLLASHFDVIRKVKDEFEKDVNMREASRANYKEKVKSQITKKLKWSKRGSTPRIKNEIDALISRLDQANLAAKQKRELRKVRSKYALSKDEFIKAVNDILKVASVEERKPAKRKYAEIVISESLV